MPTEDIEAYKTGISGDKLSDKKVEEIGLIITRTFYANHRFEINDIFRSHFSVGSDFTVEFFDRIEKGVGVKSRRKKKCTDCTRFVYTFACCLYETMCFLVFWVSVFWICNVSLIPIEFDST